MTDARPPWLRRPRARPARLLASVAALALGAGGPRVALAHGPAPASPPQQAELVLGWSFDPLVWIGLLGAGWLYLAGVRRVDRAHPATPVPRFRIASFLAGLGAIAVALQSGIGRYDTTLFSVHMVQHMLLTLVAAPLLALGAPITLLLRAVSPDRRRRLVLPLLHARPVRVLAHPVVAWLVFAGVMWGSHFSPLFDLALENPLVHQLEHAAYLAAGLLFWWPAVGADPGPWRLSHPVRLLYLLLQMPQNTFLSLAIYSAPAPLSPHYATVERAWGPDALADQQIAGAIMWVGGDLLFLAAVAGVVAAWIRFEEREAGRADARADRARAAIEARAARLRAGRVGRAEEDGRAEAAPSGGPAQADGGRGAASSSR